MKEGRQQGARYVRKIRIEGFASPAKESRRGEEKKKEPLLVLTVRGLYHGQVKMEAQDGSVYTCSKDSARGTLWGDTVEALKIGRERVAVRRVLTRAHEEITGVLHEKKGVRYIIPLERRLPQGISVRPGGEPAKDGDIVQTKVIRWEDEGGLLVRIDGVLGSFTQAKYACARNLPRRYLLRQMRAGLPILRTIRNERTCVVFCPSPSTAQMRRTLTTR